MKIKHFDTLPEDAIFIRKEVFVKEQGFKNEFDEKDNEAHFLVGYENDNPVATCRIFYDTAKNIYIFGRIAVLKPYRGMGLGSLLLTEAQSYVTAKNAKKSAFLRRCAPQAFMKHWVLSVREKNTWTKTARIFIWKKHCNFYTIFIPI